MIFYNSVSEYQLLEDREELFNILDNYSLDEVYEIYNSFHFQEDIYKYVLLRAKEYANELFGPGHNFTA